LAPAHEGAGTQADDIAGSESRNAMAEHIEVELDILSGMPNPAWVLTPAEAENFRTKLAGLRQATQRSLSGNLGYRGFILQIQTGTSSRIVRVQRGMVQISDGTIDMYFTDEARELERSLLQTGRQHVADELFRAAERDFR
jgi:hypothetical protein